MERFAELQQSKSKRLVGYKHQTSVVPPSKLPCRATASTAPLASHLQRRVLCTLCSLCCRSAVKLHLSLGTASPASPALQSGALCLASASAADRRMTTSHITAHGATSIESQASVASSSSAPRLVLWYCFRSRDVRFRTALPALLQGEPRRHDCFRPPGSLTCLGRVLSHASPGLW